METHIGIISDIHMRTPDREEVEAELQAVVDRFNDGFQPDQVIILGDIIEHEDSVETDCMNLQRVQGILSGLDAPVRYLPGNHDVEHLSRDEIEQALDQELWGRETV